MKRKYVDIDDYIKHVEDLMKEVCKGDANRFWLCRRGSATATETGINDPKSENYRKFWQHFLDKGYMQAIVPECDYSSEFFNDEAILLERI